VVQLSTPWGDPLPGNALFVKLHWPLQIYSWIVSSFLKSPCTKIIENMFIFDRFIPITRNTFCRTRSLSNATFSIFDHVTFIQFKICCCVQNFIKIWWFFTEIWQYITFENGSRPPSWNYFTTIRDHPRSHCCWPQLPVRFQVNLLYRSEDIAIWIFTDTQTHTHR